jgi:hypothetical protein
MESLLQGLLKEDPAPPRPPAPAPTRAKAKPSRKSILSQLPPSEPVSEQVPKAVLVAQIKLYVNHMGQLLESVCGKVGSTEQERWLKTINVKMAREELVGNLSAIKGTLVITNGINMIRGSVLSGMGVCESVGPYAGLQLAGLTTEIANKQSELELIATQMCIDSYDMMQDRMKPSHQLFMLCTSTAFQVHNRNSQIKAQQYAYEQSQQPVSEDVQNKYSSM